MVKEYTPNDCTKKPAAQGFKGPHLETIARRQWNSRSGNRLPLSYGRIFGSNPWKLPRQAEPSMFVGGQLEIVLASFWALSIPRTRSGSCVCRCDRINGACAILTPWISRSVEKGEQWSLSFSAGDSGFGKWKLWIQFRVFRPIRTLSRTMN